MFYYDFCHQLKEKLTYRTGQDRLALNIGRKETKEELQSGVGVKHSGAVALRILGMRKSDDAHISGILPKCHLWH